MSLKMRSEVLDEVVQRLRSGQYKQGASALRRAGMDGKPDQFCCLGVLCEMAVESGVVTRSDDVNMEGSYTYSEEGFNYTAYLPPAVIEWAGIVSDVQKNSGWSEFFYEERGTWGERDEQALAAMNDSGMPFEEIAQWMVDNVERV